MYYMINLSLIWIKTRKIFIFHVEYFSISLDLIISTTEIYKTNLWRSSIIKTIIWKGSFLCRRYATIIFSAPHFMQFRTGQIIIVFVKPSTLRARYKINKFAGKIIYLHYRNHDRKHVNSLRLFPVYKPKLALIRSFPFRERGGKSALNFDNGSGIYRTK